MGVTIALHERGLHVHCVECDELAVQYARRRIARMADTSIRAHALRANARAPRFLPLTPDDSNCRWSIPNSAPKRLKLVHEGGSLLPFVTFHSDSNGLQRIRQTVALAPQLLASRGAVEQAEDQEQPARAILARHGLNTAQTFINSASYGYTNRAVKTVARQPYNIAPRRCA
ncbi:hypothetical protein [Pseudomonas koreensis]|uniref:hypothetical protein n=1 Tax=Pseudomonas koreensis TaxID=198620 RepID=UPI003F858961